MARGIKIANPGVNALTDTNPKNFSLYVDGTTNHILIKEFARGSQSVGAFVTAEISHNLGYLPVVMVAFEVSSGEFQWVYGLNIFSDYRVWVDTTKVYITNRDSSTRTVHYYIFHDQL